MKAGWWTTCVDCTWQVAHLPTALFSLDLSKKTLDPQICVCFINKSAHNIVAPPNLGTWALKSHKFAVQVCGGHCGDPKGEHQGRLHGGGDLCVEA